VRPQSFGPVSDLDGLVRHIDDDSFDIVTALHPLGGDACGFQAVAGLSSLVLLLDIILAFRIALPSVERLTHPHSWT